MAKIVFVLLLAVIVVISFIVDEFGEGRVKFKDRDGKTVGRWKSEGFMPGDLLEDLPNDPFSEPRHYLVVEVRDNKDNVQYAKVVECSPSGDYGADSTAAYMRARDIYNKGWRIVRNIYKSK